MYRLLLVVSTLFLLGCPGPFLQDPEEPAKTALDRLEVNNTLRAACRDFYISDAEIRAYLLIMEQDRLNGWTRTEEMQAVLLGCINNAMIEDATFCTTCNIAILHQVYGFEE